MHVFLTGYPAAAWRFVMRSGIALGMYPVAALAVCVVVGCISEASCICSWLRMAALLVHSQYYCISFSVMWNCGDDCEVLSVC